MSKTPETIDVNPTQIVAPTLSSKLYSLGGIYPTALANFSGSSIFPKSMSKSITSVAAILPSELADLPTYLSILFVKEIVFAVTDPPPTLLLLRVSIAI